MKKHLTNRPTLPQHRREGANGLELAVDPSKVAEAEPHRVALRRPGRPAQSLADWARPGGHGLAQIGAAEGIHVLKCFQNKLWKAIICTDTSCTPDSAYPIITVECTVQYVHVE